MFVNYNILSYFFKLNYNQNKCKKDTNISFKLVFDVFNFLFKLNSIA